ncbi:neurturin [Colossoma macropomum]|uniref:neurturin n=1 Tax=Colossoma macropomum TaxID=42526 RepID=UPI001865115A|nr:neurturin [Colossoma macropomum]
MKLWKCAAIALTLCGAALSVFLSRILLPLKAPVPLHFKLSSFSSSSSSPLSSTASPTSSMSSNDSSSWTGGKFRRVRSANGANSVISEFMHMFQSFTEGELKQIIATLVERKAQRDAKQGKRTKRAKNGSKVCSLQEEEVTVSQLGLGYISDETFLFRYCSGRCAASRRNYDITLAFLSKSKNKLIKEDLKKARNRPCCRPTAYDKDISFLDNQSRYHTIHEVSASQCGCI